MVMEQSTYCGDELEFKENGTHDENAGGKGGGGGLGDGGGGEGGGGLGGGGLGGGGLGGGFGEGGGGLTPAVLYTVTPLQVPEPAHFWRIVNVVPESELT